MAGGGRVRSRRTLRRQSEARCTAVDARWLESRQAAGRRDRRDRRAGTNAMHRGTEPNSREIGGRVACAGQTRACLRLVQVCGATVREARSRHRAQARPQGPQSPCLSRLLAASRIARRSIASAPDSPPLTTPDQRFACTAVPSPAPAPAATSPQTRSDDTAQRAVPESKRRHADRSIDIGTPVRCAHNVSTSPQLPHPRVQRPIGPALRHHGTRRSTRSGARRPAGAPARRVYPGESSRRCHGRASAPRFSVSRVLPESPHPAAGYRWVTAG